MKREKISETSRLSLSVYRMNKSVLAALPKMEYQITFLYGYKEYKNTEKYCTYIRTITDQFWCMFNYDFDYIHSAIGIFVSWSCLIAMQFISDEILRG
jgi:hypothetical protein